MNDVRMIGTNQRRAVRAAERRRQRRSRRTWVSVLVGCLMIALAGGLAWFTIRPVIASFTAADDYPGPGSGEVTITVPQGASGTAIGQVLAKADVVKSVDAFISATNQDSRAAQIQPGAYNMRKQMSAAGALAVLIDPANRLVAKVTVKEGQRLVDILKTLSAGAKIPLAEFQAAAKDPAGLGLPSQAGGRLEGWLFPATYEVSPQTTAAGLMSEMVQRTVSELTELGVPQAKWRDTIITASLVEAERGSDQDAPKIAQVLQNRIEQDIPLQLDTTVNYALNRYKVGVSIADTKVRSPYNTYLKPGLPVGAIASPGRVAIQGVLKPAPGPWLYFVAVNPDTGETKYATTSEEFAVLQAELNEWLAANPGR